MEDQIYASLIKGVRKPKHKRALFLCGAAGTGKTTTRNKFIHDANLKTTYVMLNFDEIWIQLRNHSNTSEIYERIVKRVISEGYSFVYDGTCRRTHTILNRMSYLKTQGYEITLGIVYASLDKVLDRLEKRTYQPLKLDIGKQIYYHVTSSIEKIMKSDIPDEVFLYDNTLQTKLIFHRKSKKVYCNLDNSKFYFDVSEYC